MIGFLFPGQGAQSIGMGQALYEQGGAARDVFDQANEVLGYDLQSICFNGPTESLNATNHSQPALYVCSMAALAKLKTDNTDIYDAAEVCGGLSLGEYTAMAFAGSLSFADGLRLVQRRGEAMQSAAEQEAGSMVSVLGMELAAVEEVCDEARQDDEVLQVANILCPGNIVVSGHKSACARVEAIATQRGAMKCIELAVAGAFHTSLMAPAVEALQAALAEVEIQAPRIPVISNVDAQPHSEPDQLRQILIQQVSSPVLWQNCVEDMLSRGVSQFYEIGTGTVLRGLLKRINRKVPCENLS